MMVEEALPVAILGRNDPDWQIDPPVADWFAQPAGGDLSPAARGRFVRNAVIQGAAAEFFKAWAATVRATTRHLGARIVLCLHDELLVHAPAQRAQDVAAALEAALTDAARRWSGGAPVRFVADISLVNRWSDAKG